MCERIPQIKKLISLSPEIIEAVELAKREDESFAAAVERWLWRISEIRIAAAANGLTIRPERTLPGRPTTNGTSR